MKKLKILYNNNLYGGVPLYPRFHVDTSTLTISLKMIKFTIEIMS